VSENHPQKEEEGDEEEEKKKGTPCQKSCFSYVNFPIIC
jgi:hypothetical protein